MSTSKLASSWLAPAPPTVAVEIASRRVTVAELSVTGKGPSVTAYASETLPDAAVTPALSGSNIADPRLVADALRQAIDHAGLRSARRVALVVPDSIARVSLLTFEQLPAKPSELEQLIRWQLRKATPFPIDEAHLSHFPAHAEPGATTLAAIVARRDVLAQYERVTSAVGLHAGIVDLASFNVMNTVIAAGAVGATEDSLVVCLAGQATTLAILRGPHLMFYRHRAAVDDEPLSALVHQTSMYHEDRLGGSAFARNWLTGAASGSGGAGVERAARDIRQLGVSAESVDVRRAVAVGERWSADVDTLDALAASVGVLLRERKAA